MSTTTPAPSRRSHGRGGARVTAAVLGVAGVAGARGRRPDGEVNEGDAAYPATDFHRFASDHSAIASEDLEVDAGGAGRSSTRTAAQAAPTGQPDTAKPVSVGIARSDDLNECLAGPTPPA